MFGAIDGNEALTQALIWGVLGAIGGACYGVIAYLGHKSEAKTQSEWEARERARIEAQMNPKAGTGKTIPVWFVLVVIVAIIAGVLVANPFASRP